MMYGRTVRVALSLALDRLSQFRTLLASLEVPVLMRKHQGNQGVYLVSIPVVPGRDHEARLVF
jgi:hypothetical protein